MGSLWPVEIDNAVIDGHLFTCQLIIRDGNGDGSDFVIQAYVISRYKDNFTVYLDRLEKFIEMEVGTWPSFQP